jgi:lipid II:glycine glycyltransferase (peptidoglycan interpeptide bridge formation enzyme)
MTVYKHRGLRVAELYFDEKAKVGRADIIDRFQFSKPFHRKRWSYFYTLLIDLTKSELEIMSAMDKNCAYEIRRAREKDKVNTVILDQRANGTLDQFVRFYNEFARSAGQANVNQARLEMLNANGQLLITNAELGDLNSLVYHAYMLNLEKKRVRLLYSASQFRQSSADAEMRNIIGRANRLLHFDDIRALKSRGFITYDLGGWYPGIDDKNKLGINRFKESLGGIIEKGYNSRQAGTLLGYFFLTVKELCLHVLQKSELNERRDRQRSFEELHSKSPSIVNVL